MGWKDRVAFDALLGITLLRIEGAEVGSEQVIFVADDGRKWLMYHDQDCCEAVELNEVVGDISDLIGHPILRAEEVEGDQDAEPKPGEYSESWTWTFYKLATIKGEVVLRWLGESNGYYSESVDFEVIP